jgi:glucose-6-phosphate dehydrogenase assembly protein OpcA
MSIEKNVVAFLQGETIAVDAENIEKELAGLWQAATESQDESGRVVKRACTLNLIVYSANEGMYERAANVLADPVLAMRHPCRAIALLADSEAAKEELAAYVSAPRLSLDTQIKEDRGHLPASGEMHAKPEWVGCEQITVAAKGKAVREISRIAAPLVIRDLPAVLWWQDELPEEDLLFEQLLAVSSHLIFDSADCRDVGNVLSRARALCRSWKTSTGEAGICGDLNWLRLSRYRDLLAQFFESAAVEPLLKNIATVNLEVAATEEAYTRGGDAYLGQPLLLLGWLASRLNWKLTEPLTADSGGQVADLSAAPAGLNEPTGERVSGPTGLQANIFRTTWQSNGHEVVGLIKINKIEHEAFDASAPAGITAINLRLEHNGESPSFSLQRSWNQQQATIRTEKAGRASTDTAGMESTVPFADSSLAELIAQELDRMSPQGPSSGRDQAYEDALSVATQLI